MPRKGLFPSCAARLGLVTLISDPHRESVQRALVCCMMEFLRLMGPDMRWMVFSSILLFSGATLAQGTLWPPRSQPDAQGIDAQGLDLAVTDILSGEFGQIRSLLVLKNGVLVKEQYFGNSGGKFPVYSVTKSIGATLLGIAQHQGFDVDLSRSIMDYLPQYADINDLAAKNTIHLHHLLSQRHALDWDELSIPYGQPDNPVTLMLQQSDFYRATLEWPMSGPAGSAYAYSTGASSLMSPILHNITGQKPQDFAATELFAPLAIGDVHWELVGANPVIGGGLSEFPDDLAPLGFGLWLRPLDLAKIGQMYLDDGVWQGQRLLDSNWIRQSTAALSNGVTDPDFFGAGPGAYGYQWWKTVFTDARNRTHHAYYAAGYARQYIFILPEDQLVVISTAADYAYDGPGIGALMRNRILPALQDGPQGRQTMRADLNGSLYWPDSPAQGFNLEVLDDGARVLMYWYTYDTEGRPRWFVLTGPVNDQSAALQIHTTESGGFVYSEPIELVLWGRGELYFHDCTHASFHFISEVETLSGEIPLTRLTGGTGCVNDATLAQKTEALLLP